MNIPKWLITAVGVLLSVFLITLSLNQLNILNQKLKPGGERRTLNMSGEGKVSAVPDLATITASIVVQGSTAKEAKDKATQKYNDVVAALKTFGISDKDLQTSGYYVNPQYDYTIGAREIIGYNATESITIKVRDQKNVGKVLDLVAQKGANQIGQVQYSFSDLDGVKQQAREKAIANARDKAEKVAKISGLRLGDVINFQEQQGYPMPYLYPVGMGAGIKEGGGPGGRPADYIQPPQIEPGTNEVVVVVNLTYELK